MVTEHGAENPFSTACRDRHEGRLRGSQSRRRSRPNGHNIARKGKTPRQVDLGGASPYPKESHDMTNHSPDFDRVTRDGVDKALNPNRKTITLDVVTDYAPQFRVGMNLLSDNGFLIGTVTDVVGVE